MADVVPEFCVVLVHLEKGELRVMYQGYVRIECLYKEEEEKEEEEDMLLWISLMYNQLSET